jgi:hypothetical protein
MTVTVPAAAGIRSGWSPAAREGGSDGLAVTVLAFAAVGPLPAWSPAAERVAVPA